MTFYIDIIFLENMIMNYIILFATGLIIQKKLQHIRIFFASVIGASYVVMEYISKVEIYDNQITKFILSIAMVYIAFHPQNIKKLCKSIIIFYLTSFCFGGAAYYLLYNISPSQIKNMNGILTGSYPIKIAILGGILGFFIIHIAFKVVKNRIDKNSIFYEVEICYQQKSTIIRALLDTGNLLLDPITSLPVVIVESKKLENILDKKSLNIMSNVMFNYLDTLDDELKTRCRLIPFSSVGKSNGMIMGFRPDYIKIYQDEEEYMIKDTIIGVYKNKLSKNNYYAGLIGLELLNSDNGKIGDLNEYHSNAKG